jgi:hypothetical protein
MRDILKLYSLITIRVLIALNICSLSAFICQQINFQLIFFLSTIVYSMYTHILHVMFIVMFHALIHRQHQR